MKTLSTEQKKADSQRNGHHHELSGHVSVGKGGCRGSQLVNPADLEEILANTQESDERSGHQENRQKAPDVPLTLKQIYG